MKIWTLSLAGNIATERQVTALADALVQTQKAPAEILHFFPTPPITADTSSNTGVTWTSPLSEQQLSAQGLVAPWPDLIVACRPEVAAVALGIKEASAGKTRIVQIQSPNGVTGHYAFHLAAFDIIVPQPQDALFSPNVVGTKLALHGITPALLEQFSHASHEVSLAIKSPVLIALIGGSDEHIRLNQEAFHALGEDLYQAALPGSGSLVVLTSRRTDENGKHILHEKLHGLANVFFDDPRINYMTALAIGDEFLITAESLSMFSEVIATGKPCRLNMCGGALVAHPVARYISSLGEYPINERPDIARRIWEKLNMGSDKLPN